MGPLWRLTFDELLKVLTVSNVTAVIALVISFLAWRTARRSAGIAARAAAYEYTIRLQIRDEEMGGLDGLDSPHEVFRYSAKLVNVGLKPVRIDHVYIDYGGETLENSWHHVVDGLSDRPPQGERPINFRLRRSEHENARSQFNITKCCVRLRVAYFDVAGNIVEAKRPLIAFGPGRAPIFYYPRGDALT